MKKRFLFILACIISVMIAGCGKKEIIDYADAESFEAALNQGANLEGKIVRFKAVEIHPESALGFNVWAGEHLNFVSSRNPDIKQGDTVIVRTGTIENVLGSWVIKYEKVKGAEVGDNTISAAAPAPAGEESTPAVESDADAAQGFSIEVDNTKEELPLELIDSGCYIDEPSEFSDDVYANFCAIIHNPNETLKAEFPKVNVTVKNSAGNVLATETQTGNSIMPGDTVTLVGMLSMQKSDLEEEPQIFYDIEWSELSDASVGSTPKASDFEITNVSERNGSDQNLITGEITNNSANDTGSVNLSLVLRKDGAIVFMENTFVDGLTAGKTKAFEFQRYHAWPEHDTIDISGQFWY